MNYYIKGDKERAEQIKAAFEELGYEIPYPEGLANPQALNIGVERNGERYVVAEASEYIKDIIKTHPDYQELELPVEPKFKVGDWVVYNEANVYQVKEIDNNGTIPRYKLESIDGIGLSVPFTSVYGLKKWTITDAKNGDVLYSLDSKQPFIYKVRPQFSQAIGYCCINKFGDFAVWNTNKCIICTDKYIPATKEQRDLLFQKMEEAGYEWDSDKKELLKIKHYAIVNFQPFDKVLVRCGNDEEWIIEFYCKYDTLVHTSPHRDYPFMGIGDSYSQCIPFNDDTKHLLGTTDMPSEEYINW